MKELITIQAKLKAPKGQYNSFGKYNYRNCEDILEAVKPLLEENGATLTLSDEMIEVGGRIYVKATATFQVGDKTTSVSAFAREPESKKGMDESQITGAASSYARKYALNGLFCIDDTKDADTMDNSKTQKETPKDKDKDYKDYIKEALIEIDIADSRATFNTIWKKYREYDVNNQILHTMNAKMRELNLLKH